VPTHSADLRFYDTVQFYSAQTVKADNVSFTCGTDSNNLSDDRNAHAGW